MKDLGCHELRNAIVVGLIDDNIVDTDEDDPSMLNLDSNHEESFFVTTHDDEKFHITIVKVK